MNTKKIIASVLLLTTLVGCGNKTNNKEEQVKPETEIKVDKEEKEETKEVSKKDYNFYLDGDGNILNENEIKGKKIVRWYTDPGCIACVQVDSKVDKEELYKVLKEENAVIKYNYVGLQDTTYGNKMASYVLSVLNNDKDLAVKFANKIMSESYAKLTKEPDSEETIKKTYEELGGTKWDVVNEKAPEYAKLVQDKSNEYIDDEEMLGKSPTGQLFTPFIYVEGSDEALTLSTNDKGELNLTETLKEKLESVNK